MCNDPRLAYYFPHVPQDCSRPQDTPVPTSAYYMPPNNPQHTRGQYPPAPQTHGLSAEASQAEPFPRFKTLAEYAEWADARARMVKPRQEKTHAQSLLNFVVPGFQVQKFDNLSTAKLLRYRVESQEGNTYLITTPPNYDPGLTREERDAVRSEAALWSWLALVPGTTRSPATLLSPCSLSPEPLEDVRPVGVCRRGCRTSPLDIMKAIIDYSKPPPPIDAPSGQILRRQGSHPLQAFLPQLVEHGTIERLRDPDVEYTLAKPVPGNVVADLPIPLTPQERVTVDTQTGQLLRCMSTLLSPTRRFGYAADVLDYPLTRATLVRNPHARLSKGVGFACWSDAFRTMQENALRDCEDRGVQISYDSIRFHGERFIPILDRIKRPKLVAIDVADDTNILIRRKATSDQAQESFGTATDKDEESEQNDTVQVTGLRDWRNCIFGDPLIAVIFNCSPSPEFWQGFENISPGQDAGLEPIDDKTNAHVRLILYEMYHASTIIGQEYTRGADDNGEREMQGRKRLVTALKKIRELDNQGRPLHTKPEQEPPASKRTKRSC